MNVFGMKSPCSCLQIWNVINQHVLNDFANTSDVFIAKLSEQFSSHVRYGTRSLESHLTIVYSPKPS